MMRCSIAVALVALLAVSAEAAKPPTVLAAVLASPDLSLLAAAVKAADPAVAKLLGSKAFGGTVFAPTNTAFLRLLKDLKLKPAQLLKQKALVTEVLLYHVFPSFPIYAKDLKIRQWIQTLVKGHPGVLKITKKKVVRLYTTSGGSALVVKADIKAGKAVVHKINRVLVPGKKVWWPKAKVIT